ncbi:PilN domain-containing protein [Acidisoma sp.]|uniref:PilN domain-containing protein n=1 Tax=Acidisoma sp. TaxID=1872115 RepID=UPI003AFFDD1B
MLKEFVTWWARQWLDLLPPQLTATNRWSNALVIDLPTERDETGSIPFALIRRLRGKETPLGRFRTDDSGIAAIRRARRVKGRSLDILLRLWPGALLEHRFAIPLAAEHDAAEVLRYEIDRVTPFTAEDIFWTWEAERRDRERGRLFVRLSLVPRASVLSGLRVLAAAGLSPRRLEVAAEDGSLRHLPLQTDARAGETLQRGVVRVLAAVCAVLAIVAGVLPFVFQQARIQHTEREIAQLQPRVSEAVMLRRRILGQAAGADVIAAAEVRIGDAVQALAAVTEVMPDNTFLTAFSLSQRNLSLTGQSTDPAGLIAAMSADPMIASPSFSAPVTAAPTGKGSLFSINAELAP